MKKVIFKHLLVASLLGGAITANATTTERYTAVADMSEAAKLYRDKKYKEAALIWLEESKQGDALAQVNLSRIYYMGRGVEQDFNKALKWIKASLDQGNIYAMYDYARMHLNGRGVKADVREANKWFSKSAEKGYPLAQHQLGKSYYEGRGVRKNYFEAHKWFLAAANNGHAESMHRIGEAYRKGVAAKQNNIQAKEWYSKGCLADHQPSCVAYQKLDELNRVDKDHSTIREYAEKGDVRGQFQIGYAHFKGIGANKDLLESLYWFKEAADRGLRYAMTFTGLVYESNHSCPNAISWWQKAAGKKEPLAMNLVKATPETRKTGLCFVGYMKNY